MINSTKAIATIRRYNELIQKAETMYRDAEKYSSDGLRFSDCGTVVEHKINTSCNCHPEYNFEHWKSAEEFGEWLDKQ